MWFIWIDFDSNFFKFELNNSLIALSFKHLISIWNNNLRIFTIIIRNNMLIVAIIEINWIIRKLFQ